MPVMPVMPVKQQELLLLLLPVRHRSPDLKGIIASVVCRRLLLVFMIITVLMIALVRDVLLP